MDTLAERIGNGCTEFDVAIDLPITPKLSETQHKIIKISNNFVPLKDIFPQKGWLDSYMSDKWKGHIFESEKYRKKACEEGMVLLKEQFEIKFNDRATDEAKILPIYKKQRTISEF